MLIPGVEELPAVVLPVPETDLSRSFLRRPPVEVETVVCSGTDPSGVLPG